MNFRWIVLATLAGLMPVDVQAGKLEFPVGAVQIADQLTAMASTAIPVAPFQDGGVQSVVAEGQVSATAWQVPNSGLSTLQIMVKLRDQIVADGFEILLDCDQTQCGGFDFRYELDLISEPDMHVDLGDYRFVSAKKTTKNAAPEYISLMVSRSSQTGFVQITTVSPQSEITPTEVTRQNNNDPAILPTALTAGSLANLLTTSGSAPLEDLVFQTGSSQLGDTTFDSLRELAEFLKTNPTLKIALVGHTDAQGSLENNLALSKKRAASVVERLVLAHGASPSQMEAAGVGYLSPRAANLTEEGRTKNRRVEVILTSVSSD